MPAVGRGQLSCGSVAAGLGMLTARWSKADLLAANGGSWALLSDAHVSGNPDEIKNQVNLFQNLNQVLAEVRGLTARLAGLFVHGDQALLEGKPSDDKLLTQLMGTISNAEIRVHLSLGNHDQRDNFWHTFAGQMASEPLVESRQISLAESPRVNWFLLDSFVTTNGTPGELGEKQLNWLRSALETRPDKPAIVGVLSS